MIMKLLVIEDEHKIANSIKKGLEQEAMTVDVAYDGEEGFDLASEGKYDLIVLDLMLPKMDGVEVCKKLRSQQVQTPILMLTAMGQLDDKVKGLNSGGDDYLVKPFAFAELLARVRALGRRPTGQIKMVLKVADLELDTVKFEVKRDGKQIGLSRKEFALLEYLMRHANKVVTKEQIIEAIWDYDADVLPNTVEVFIGYLRQKIDKPFSGKHRLIETVRGFGYKLTGE